MSIISATDDEMAFIRAVLAAPQDDAPRLVFADWLEENGQPDTAAIMRVQVSYKDRLTGDYGLSTRLCTSDSGDGLRAALDWRLGFVSAFVCTHAFFIDYFDEMKVHHPINNITLMPSVDQEDWPPLSADDIDLILEKCGSSIRVIYNRHYRELTPEYARDLRIMDRFSSGVGPLAPQSAATWIPGGRLASPVTMGIDPAAQGSISRGSLVYRSPSGLVSGAPESLGNPEPMAVDPVIRDIMNLRDANRESPLIDGARAIPSPDDGNGIIVQYNRPLDSGVDQWLRQQLGLPPLPSEEDEASDGEV